MVLDVKHAEVIPEDSEGFNVDYRTVGRRAEHAVARPTDTVTACRTTVRVHEQVAPPQ